MEYFKKELIQQLNAKIGYEGEVVESTVWKNNDIKKQGIAIRMCNKNVSKQYYLDFLADMMKAGKSFEEIIDFIISDSKQDTVDIENIVEELMDNNNIRERIIVKMTSTLFNHEYLKDKVYMTIEGTEFVAVFHILVGKMPNNVATAAISKKMWERLDLHSPEIEYDYALKNTMREFPPLVKNLFDVLTTKLFENVDMLECKDAVDMQILILGNEIEVNGATCILYTDVLKNIAKQFDANLIIIPSSCHEVLLIPYNSDEMNATHYKQMVREVNDATVGEEEILSNNVYLYDLENDKIREWN